jgi:hypothetical protein
MSASETPRAEWLDSQFWERLDRIEVRHRQIQSQHDAARRTLERANVGETQELRDAWRRYCDVIDELDRTTDEFAALRARGD